MDWIQLGLKTAITSRQFTFNYYVARSFYYSLDWPRKIKGRANVAAT